MYTLILDPLARALVPFITETNADYNIFHFHTNVRWLSKESITKLVFKFGDILKLVFNEQKKTYFFDWSNDEN